MFSLSNLSIRGKILTIVFLNLAFLCAIAFILFYNFNIQKNAKTDLVYIGEALSHFQDADMKHDAMRGDVYRMLYIDKSDKKLFKEVSNQFESDGKDFQKNIDQIGQLSVSENIQEARKNVIPALNEYYDFGQEMFRLGEKNDSTSLTELKFKENLFETKFEDLQNQQYALFDIIKKESEDTKARSEATDNKARLVILLVILVSIIVTTAISIYIANVIRAAVVHTKDKLNFMSEGNLPAIQKIKSKDEIGDMLQSINVLTENLGNVKVFANKVGEGAFDADIMVFNNAGELGGSLNNMKIKLGEIAKEDEKRNWVTTGLADVGELFRKSNENQEEFYNNITSYITKYTNSTQGALFLLMNEEENDLHLELQSTFAFEHTRKQTKRIDLNEGLVGQCASSLKTILVDDVPTSYIKITSGLGQHLPKQIIVIPLKLNGELYGVLELASFYEFEPHKIEFLEKLSEGLAATISAVKNTDKNKRMLENSKNMTDMMQTQEEMLRQTMEEMMATQEEVERNTNSYIERIKELETQMGLNNSTENNSTEEQ